MTYRTEFPDFAAADMPAIPAGFEDTSWHHDACPSFHNEAYGLALFIEHVDPAKRDLDGPRFILCPCETIDGTLEHGDAVKVTDDWSEMVAFVAEWTGQGAR